MHKLLQSRCTDAIKLSIFVGVQDGDRNYTDSELLYGYVDFSTVHKYVREGMEVSSSTTVYLNAESIAPTLVDLTENKDAIEFVIMNGRSYSVQQTDLYKDPFTRKLGTVVLHL